MRTLAYLRNIGIIAHVDAGKTTATERILYYTGLTHRIGNVDDGNTVTDSDPMEGARGITISSAAVTTNWNYPAGPDAQSYTINLIDTPGHVDFTAEVERSLRVLDGAIALFDARAGVEPQSENVWRQADRYGVPRLAFVNKMDREGADFFRVVDEIRDMLGANAVPLQVPIGHAGEFQGVIDLITLQALVWEDGSDGRTWQTTAIPTHLLDQVNTWRNNLLEQAALFDDALMEAFLDEQAIDSQQLIGAIRAGTLRGELIPVLAGAAFKNKGVQPVLDAVAAYLPSPLDKGAVSGFDPETEEPVAVDVQDTGPVAGLVFKVTAGKFTGPLSMVRIYTGRVQEGDSLLNVRTGKLHRVSKLMQLFADKSEKLESAAAGTICAISGLKDVRTGDTLTSPELQLALHPMTFPDPVIGYAIEPVSNQDETRFAQALARLQAEDPTLQVQYDSETGQTLLRGMGELHLEVIVDRMRENHGVAVNRGAPQVAYREEVTETVLWHKRYKKQTGGSGNFAEIKVEVGPAEPGTEGLQFVDAIKGGVIPKEFIPAVARGFEQAMQHGVLAGYPLESLRVRLLDGSYHSDDSHSIDFETAAREAFREAVPHAAPRILEPVMRVEVQTPELYTGAVTGDLNRRRGIIESMEVKGHLQVVKALVPLSELFSYETDLRGLTSGRGSQSLFFARYSAVPKPIEATLLDA